MHGGSDAGSSVVRSAVNWLGGVGSMVGRVGVGRLFVYCCGRCSCVHLRGEPVSSYFSMAFCSVVSY